MGCIPPWILAFSSPARGNVISRSVGFPNCHKIMIFITIRKIINHLYRSAILIIIKIRKMSKWPLCKGDSVKCENSCI